MATIVNARDVKLQGETTRVANISAAANLVVSQSQVTGLGIVLDSTKRVSLEASTQVFQVAKSGTVSPASTTLTAILSNLTSAAALTVVSGTITPAPTLSNGTVTIANTALITDTATIRLTVVENGKTYTDDMTIAKVREGLDSLSALLTNEAVTLPADTAGNVLSYTGAGGTFKVFQGATDVTSLCSFQIIAGGNPSGLVATIGVTTGVYSVTGGYPTATDLTNVTFRATFGSAVIDKIFTIAKSKAGANGSPGTPGTNGQRGSKTFYIALAGTTATWSDSLAASTASVSGGPVINDTVVQYNNSQNFSQTKFWDGAVWNLVNAVVDGNLLVAGTIGAGKLAANAVQAANIAAGQITVDKLNGGVITGSWIAGQTITATHVLAGSLTADRLDTRGLSIKDAAGNVIFSSGVPLDSSRVTPVIMNQNYAPSLSRWVSTNPSTVSLQSAGLVRSADNGLWIYYSATANFETMSSPLLNLANDWYTVSFMAYCTGAARSLHVDLFPDDLPESIFTLTTTPQLYTASWLVPAGTSRTSCKLRFFGPALAGSDIVIYQPQLEGGVNATPWKPCTTDTIGVNNPVTSGNVYTFIGAAAIQDAHIGNYIKSAAFDGTFDVNGNMAYVGTVGWGISKNGKAVFNNVIVRKVIDPVSGIVIPSVASAAWQGNFADTGTGGFSSTANPDGGWNGNLRLYGSNNHGGVPFNQRARYAPDPNYPLTFFITLNAVVDDGITLWARVNGGAWVRLFSTITAGAGDSFGSVAYTLTTNNTSVFPAQTFLAGDYIDFAATGTHYAPQFNPPDVFADSSKRYMNYVSFTINCVNI